MESPIAPLVAAALDLQASWLERAFSSSGLSAEAQSMTDEGLDTMLARLGAVQRALDALRVSVAGAVADRSRLSLGGDGLAKRTGFARPSLLLAERWGVSVPEAGRLCDVGLATRARRALNGEPLPARYPAVAEAVEAGTIGVDGAAAIVRELESASARCSDEARASGERLLVEHAQEFGVEELRRLARLVRDRIDEDGAEPRDELRRARRSLRISTTSDGLTHLDWYLDPADAGLVKAGIDAIVGAQLRRPGGAAPGPADVGSAGSDSANSGSPGSIDVADAASDDRSLDQLRSDAAVEIFRHVATCAGAAGDLPSTTVVVRMTLESLLGGLGRAEIEGTDETISATRARQLAADAEFVPVVLGGRGEVLDVGVARRLFTRAQRIAFAERDGGCAFGGCRQPPAYTEAHHIRWWSRGGRTDLGNGILLCSHHHHRVHEDGWEISIVDGVPHFIPPPHVDSSRRPRRGGRVDLARLRA